MQGLPGEAKISAGRPPSPGNLVGMAGDVVGDLEEHGKDQLVHAGGGVARHVGDGDAVM